MLNAMKIYQFLITFLCLITIAVSSYGEEQSLTGKWAGTGPSGDKTYKVAHLEMVFRPDGTMTTISKFGSQSLITRATYTLQKDNIVVHILGATINGKPSPGSEEKETRTYPFRLNGDKLVFTSPEYSTPVNLERITASSSSPLK